jgi:hypothetical protein
VVIEITRSEEEAEEEKEEKSKDFISYSPFFYFQA